MEHAHKDKDKGRNLDISRVMKMSLIHMRIYTYTCLHAYNILHHTTTSPTTQVVGYTPPPCASMAAVPKVQAKQRFNAHPVLRQSHACA